ncbi:MAG: hypothetical protein OWU33_02380 [Firmicutes bacterium]|nr:hypothetical protein [Bacillota bacterium]
MPPAYGYSQGHRPDLTQRLMTLLVNREGVPLFGTGESGHRWDQTLNADMIDRLVSALNPEQLRQLISVADSALVTGPNLARLAAADLAFVSRCPETFAVVTTAKAAAWAADAWIPVGRLALRADGATDWASEHAGVIDGRSYRLVVSRSSASDPRAALDRWIAAAADEGHAVSGTVESRTHQTRRGRPRKRAAPAETVTTWHEVPTVGPVAVARRERAITERSALVLITTVPADRWSAAELLAEYQGPGHGERHCLTA